MHYPLSNFASFQFQIMHYPLSQPRFEQLLQLPFFVKCATAVLVILKKKSISKCDQSTSLTVEQTWPKGKGDIRFLQRHVRNHQLSVGNRAGCTASCEYFWKHSPCAGARILTHVSTFSLRISRSLSDPRWLLCTCLWLLVPPRTSDSATTFACVQSMTISGLST